MIDPELAARLDAIEAKAEAARVASEKVRRSILVGRIITVALFLLPLVGLVFALPSFFDYYTQIGNLTGGLR